MTPSNGTLDKETSAVAEAFKNIPKQTETVNDNGGNSNADANANNSRQNSERNTEPEKTNGTSTKVIKVSKPTQKDKVQNASEQVQQQTQSTIKPEDFEKHLSERFKMDSNTLGTKLKRVDELEQLMQKSPYLTPKGQVLDELLSKNVSPETAIKYINADKDTMSHKDIMALAMHVDNPALPMETINDYLDQTYKLGNYAEKDGDGNPIEKPGLTRLAIEVQPHLKKFDDLKSKMLNNEDTRTSLATKQKEVERVKGWEKPTQEIFEKFTKIEVKTPGGATLEYGIEMDAEESAELQEEFNEMVLRNPLQATEEGIANAKAILQARYITRHFDEIALAFMGQGRSISDNEWRNEIHNPSMPNGKGPVHQRAEGRDEALSQMIIQAESGGKGNRKN